jgi:hypothetical protein
MNDFIDHFVWILSFEKSQPDYLCRYLDFKTKNLNPKVVKDSKMWDMYYLKGFEKKETNLKSLEEVIELDSHTKKTIQLSKHSTFPSLSVSRGKPYFNQVGFSFLVFKYTFPFKIKGNL